VLALEGFLPLFLGVAGVQRLHTWLEPSSAHPSSVNIDLARGRSLAHPGAQRLRPWVQPSPCPAPWTSTWIVVAAQPSPTQHSQAELKTSKPKTVTKSTFVWGFQWKCASRCSHVELRSATWCIFRIADQKIRIWVSRGPKIKKTTLEMYFKIRSYF